MQPFNLMVKTDIPLPGYISAEGDADVVVRYGNVPGSLPDAVLKRACAQMNEGKFLFVMENVARYLVENGKQITIQPYPGVSETAIRLFLQGAVWSALLLQRGLLPIHGSCFRLGDKGIVLSGPSSCGKSTLVAALMDRGYPIIADELCALVVHENAPPMLLPGFPQILLWADSLLQLQKNSQSLTRVQPGLEKYILPCQDKSTGEALPLERIYILKVVNTPLVKLTPLTGAQKVQALIESTYRVHHVTGHGLNRSHFNQCTNIARYIDVKRMERPDGSFHIEGMIKRLEEDF